MKDQTKSHEDKKSIEAESYESTPKVPLDEERAFNPDATVLVWEGNFQNGDRSMYVKMPICQGTVKDAIRTGYLTYGFPSMEGNEISQFLVGTDGIQMETSPAPAAPVGKKPSGQVTPSAPVATAAHQPPVPNSAQATADTEGDGLGDTVKDTPDDLDKLTKAFKELMLKEVLSGLHFNWKFDPKTGEGEIHVAADKDGGKPIVITPSAMADPGAPSEQPGHIVVSCAKGEKIVQYDDKSPTLTEIRSKPVVTQAAGGAGNIVDSSFTSNGDIKLNGLFNAIGFLFQAALSAKITFIINIGTGAGADTS